MSRDFDVRNGSPRPTALAVATASLVADGEFDHPVLDRAGWWRRDERFYHPLQRSGLVGAVGSPRRLAITGATGTLGQAFSRICEVRGLDYDLLSRTDMDIANPASVEHWHGQTESALAAGRRVEASDALLVSPTYVPDPAHGTLDLLVS